MVYDNNKTEEKSESEDESNTELEHPTVATSGTPIELHNNQRASNDQLAIDLQTAMTLAGKNKRGATDRTPPSDSIRNDSKFHKPSNSPDGSLHTANLHEVYDQDSTLKDVDNESLI